MVCHRASGSRRRQKATADNIVANRSAPSAKSGTVARTVEILRFIGERKRSSIHEVSVELMLPPSTVHRLFDLLAREGMIEQDKIDRSYRAGAEFFRISAQVVGRYDLRTIALPIMREVVAACDETCVLGLYLPTVRKMTLADRLDSTRLLRYQLPMNTHLSLLSGASGRCILAGLPEDEIKAIFDSERAAPRNDRLPAWNKLTRDLQLIRKQGFAISRGEMIAGAMAIAAPIIGAEGAAIASIAVTAPNERMQRAGPQRVSELLRDKARELSFRLGAPTPRSEPPAKQRPAPMRSRAQSRSAART